MGIIKKEVTISGFKGEERVTALFDSGSEVTIIKKEIAKKVVSILKLPTPASFTMADGSKGMETNNITVLSISINGATINYHVYVVDKLTDDFIIGVDALQRWKIKLDFDKDEVSIDPQVLRLRI